MVSCVIWSLCSGAALLLKTGGVLVTAAAVVGHPAATLLAQMIVGSVLPAPAVVDASPPRAGIWSCIDISRRKARAVAPMVAGTRTERGVATPRTVRRRRGEVVRGCVQPRPASVEVVEHPHCCCCCCVEDDTAVAALGVKALSNLVKLPC